MNPAVLRAYPNYALEDLHLESAREGSVVVFSSPLSHSTSPPPTPPPDATAPRCSLPVSPCMFGNSVDGISLDPADSSSLAAFESLVSELGEILDNDPLFQNSLKGERSGSPELGGHSQLSVADTALWSVSNSPFAEDTQRLFADTSLSHAEGPHRTVPVTASVGDPHPSREELSRCMVSDTAPSEVSNSPLEELTQVSVSDSALCGVSNSPLEELSQGLVSDTALCGPPNLSLAESSQCLVSVATPSSGNNSPPAVYTQCSVSVVNPSSVGKVSKSTEPSQTTILCWSLVKDGALPPGFAKEFESLAQVLEESATRVHRKVVLLDDVKAAVLLHHRKGRSPRSSGKLRSTRTNWQLQQPSSPQGTRLASSWCDMKDHQPGMMQKVRKEPAG